MNLALMPLTGDAQHGELAQILLAADRSLPRPLPPSLPTPDFSRFQMPVIANAMEADSLLDLLRVQPLDAAPGGVMHMEFITAEMAEEAHNRERAAYMADLADGEILHEFELGGVLSMRGGYFITHRDRPELVLRYAVTRMS